MLNTKIEDRKSYIKANALFAKVPYLNGGLFSPSEIDCYHSNELGGYSDIKVPNEVFETLFEILKIYHFTIDEQSPSDQEVGLDPELLGQIFENLLAEFNPETKESARKATGSYYTPREIVRYVVCQSLFESLKNHDLVIVSVSVAIENLSPTRHCEQTQ